jgi:hypothetical protein
MDTVGKLRALIADLPDDAEIVAVEYHQPLTDLGPDDYDDYAGLPTDNYKAVGFEVKDGKLIVDAGA